MTLTYSFISSFVVEEKNYTGMFWKILYVAYQSHDSNIWQIYICNQIVGQGIFLKQKVNIMYGITMIIRMHLWQYHEYWMQRIFH